MASRIQTPPPNKLLLFPLGALLAVLTVEIMMWAGATAWTAFASSSATPSYRSRGVFRILCLGESTTAPTGGHDISWPAQLQNILNTSAQEGKYEVINRGVPGTNTGIILARLPRYLDQIQPNLVITMLGTNDDQWYGIVNFKNGRWGWVERCFLKLRVVKLINYIDREFIERRGETVNSAGDMDPGRTPLDRRCLIVETHMVDPTNFRSWEIACRKAIHKRPNNVTLYKALMAGYQQMNRLDAVIDSANTYAELGGTEGWPYTLLIKRYAERRMYTEAERIYRKALASVSKDSTQVHLAMAKLYSDQNQDARATRFYLRAVQETNAESTPPIIVKKHKGHFPIKVGKMSPVTAANYKSLQSLLATRHIPLVAMQYPTKDVAELKALFNDPAGIYYISNKENFARALSRGRYSDYFTDRLQHTWGHCSAAGNRLIAENLAGELRKHGLLKLP